MILNRQQSKKLKHHLLNAGADREEWRRVVSEVEERFRGTEQEALLYFMRSGRPAEQTAAALHIDRGTYFRWRNEVLLFTAIKAAEAGILSV